MDQVKIGRFIAERRRNAGLTQIQLAEKLSITDRAVSKWETGRTMPDSAIMLELCAILSISVNDLLCGEVVLVENYNKGNDYDLLSDYCCCFPAWVNHRYCAMDILSDPDYYNYNDLYEMWEEEMMSDIDCGCFDELEHVWEDEEDDDD